jgi:8-oxo-dGTP diphosphatase
MGGGGFPQYNFGQGVDRLTFSPQRREVRKENIYKMASTSNYYSLDKSEAFLVSQKACIFHHGKLLILGRKDGDSYEWELPGGLLEMHETMIDGLAREIKEETGLMAVIKKLLCTWDHRIPSFSLKDGRVLDCRVIELAYLCSITNAEIVLSNEHDIFEWIDIRDLAKYSWHDNSRYAVEYITNLGDLGALAVQQE